MSKVKYRKGRYNTTEIDTFFSNIYDKYGVDEENILFLLNSTAQDSIKKTIKNYKFKQPKLNYMEKIKQLGVVIEYAQVTSQEYPFFKKFNLKITIPKKYDKQLIEGFSKRRKRSDYDFYESQKGYVLKRNDLDSKLFREFNAFDLLELLEHTPIKTLYLNKFDYFLSFRNYNHIFHRELSILMSLKKMKKGLCGTNCKKIKFVKKACVPNFDKYLVKNSKYGKSNWFNTFIRPALIRLKKKGLVEQKECGEKWKITSKGIKEIDYIKKNNPPF